MDVGGVSWYLGVFLVVSGILSFLPVPVAVYYSEPVLLLLVRCLFFCFLGAVFMQNERRDLDFRHAMLLVALSLLIIPFFGAIPFFAIMDGSPVDVLFNGYFESVSGYTTSGLTVIPARYLDMQDSDYRHSLIFSRALMEWTGGLGIIVLFLSLLARGGISTVFLYRVEGGRRIVPSIDHTAKIILRIYVFYTFVGAALLFLLDSASKIGPLYAVSLMMSVISTGGFVSLVEGVELNIFSELVVLAFLLLAAIPFTLDYILLSGDIKRFFSHLEVRFAFFIMAFALIAFSSLALYSGLDLFSSVYQSLLITVSSITTSGYKQSIVPNLCSSEMFLVIVLMLIGGGAGSTAGGLKVIRVGVLLEGIKWFIRKLSLPESAIFPFKIDGNVFSDEELRNIALYFFIYVSLLLAGTFVIVTWGNGPGGQACLEDAFFLSVSAQSNVGFSTLDLVSQSLIVKISLVFQMIAGRLEIFPILALVGYFLKGFGREVVGIEHDIIEKEHKIIAKKKKDQEMKDRSHVMRRIMNIGEDEDEV